MFPLVISTSGKLGFARWKLASWRTCCRHAKGPRASTTTRTAGSSRRSTLPCWAKTRYVFVRSFLIRWDSITGSASGLQAHRCIAPIPMNAYFHNQKRTGRLESNVFAFVCAEDYHQRQHQRCVRGEGELSRSISACFRNTSLPNPPPLPTGCVFALHVVPSQ